MVQRPFMDRRGLRSIPTGAASHNLFSSHGMCYPVCGMVNMKDYMLLIQKSSASVFPLSLTVALTVCPTSYNRKQNVLSALLNNNLNVESRKLKNSKQSKRQI